MEYAEEKLSGCNFINNFNSRIWITNFCKEIWKMLQTWNIKDSLLESKLYIYIFLRILI